MVEDDHCMLPSLLCGIFKFTGSPKGTIPADFLPPCRHFYLSSPSMRIVFNAEMIIMTEIVATPSLPVDCLIAYHLQCHRVKESFSYPLQKVCPSCLYPNLKYRKVVIVFLIPLCSKVEALSNIPNFLV